MIPAAVQFAGARHVCPARFVCAGLSAPGYKLMLRIFPVLI